jgi:hypothetical protein
MCLPLGGLARERSVSLWISDAAWLERGEHIDLIREYPPRCHTSTKDAQVVIIGIDPHKASHVAVAIDDNEKVLSELKERASRQQRARLLQ